MTGNNKVWRGPVAGLASVAMLATMGVATANAVTNNGSVHAGDYTVTGAGFDSSVAVYPGETYANAYAANKSMLPAFSAGVYTVDGEAFDPYSTPINADTKVDYVAPQSGNSVTVKFEGVDVNTTANLGDGTPNVILPFSDTFQVAKNTVLGSVAVPRDIADGLVVTEWSVQFSDKTTPTTVSNADLANLNVEDPAKGGTITIKPSKIGPAKHVTFHAVSSMDSDTRVAGGYVDGWLDDNLDVDVAEGATVAAPGSVVSGTKTQYRGITGWVEKQGVTDPDVQVGGAVDGSVAKYYPVFGEINRVYFVDFTDGSDKILQVIDVSDSGYVKTSDVKTPSKDGYYFVGWYTDYTLASKVPMAGGTYDFAQIKINDSMVFYAKFNEGSTVHVTFSAGTYDGAPEDVTVEYSPEEFVDEADAPDRTRDGYVLKGWYTDIDGSGIKDNHLNFDFDKTVAGKVVSDSGLAPAASGMDFTLYADWVVVDSKDTVDAAFDYVTEADKDFFTAASWKEFSAAYKAAKQKYASYTYSTDTVTAAQASELVSDLKSAWEKLVFVHNSDADPLARVTVHRLSKDSEHFYTNDAKELAYMVATQGWTDEGRLFQTADPNGVDKFASFDNEQLAAAADPIVKPVYRLYNKATGDHVWTVDANEHAVLAAQADWNDEDVAFYTPAFTGTTDVVRLYKANRHLLSTDAHEQNVLASQQGWTNEGTAFLGY